MHANSGNKQLTHSDIWVEHILQVKLNKVFYFRFAIKKSSYWHDWMESYWIYQTTRYTHERTHMRYMRSMFGRPRTWKHIPHTHTHRQSKNIRYIKALNGLYERHGQQPNKNKKNQQKVSKDTHMRTRQTHTTTKPKYIETPNINGYRSSFKS